MKRWRTTFLRKVFAICSAFQAFAWFILATICIVLYYVKPASIATFEAKMTDEDSSFVDLLSFCLYRFFLDRSNPPFIQHVIQPFRFHFIVWTYLVLSGCWAVISVVECLALFKGKFRQHGRRFQITSGVLILILSTLDVVLFSLALYDYHMINVFDRTHLKETEDDQGNIDCDYQENLDYLLRYFIGRKIAFGVLATLAARGFVLWLFNAVVGFYSVVHPIQILQMPPLLQYEEPIPRPKLVPESKNKSSRSSVEPSFADDQSDLFSSLPPEKRNWYYGRAPLPLTYHDQTQEPPRFANSRHRQTSTNNERF